MSFDLGNWAGKLSCDLCTNDPVPNLTIHPEYLDKDLPDDFWDKSEEAPEDGFDIDLPDFYPTISIDPFEIGFHFEGTF